MSAVFPAKGDPRHPPQWFWRALLWTVIAVYLALFVFDAFGKLADVIAVVILSFFFALALEPVVLWLEKKSVNKKAATVLCLFVSFLVIVAFIALFGSILVTQMINLVQNAPELYRNVADLLDAQFKLKLPGSSDIVSQFASQYGAHIGEQLVMTSLGLLTLLLDVLTIMLIVYYLCSQGHKFRSSIAITMPHKYQKRFIRVYTIIQAKVGGFLGSRLILAVISTVFVSSVCFFMNIPYWLALGILMGVISQFVPTVGVYIGGALPVIVAFASQGLVDGIIFTVIIIVYQNVENMVIMPKVSQEALDLNPAVAFLSVIGGGFIFGPLGAFLALPTVATIATVLKFAMHKYDIIDIEEIMHTQKRALK